MSGLRISEKDFQRLRRQARERVGSPVLKTGRARPAADAKGKETAAGGRLPRIAYDGPEVSIHMDLAPRPKERARTFVDESVLIRAFAAAHGDTKRFIALIKSKARGGDREGSLMRTITPEDTKRYEEAVAILVRAAMSAANAETFTCPVEIQTVFRFEGDPATWPTGTPDGDLDNLVKAVFDGMNKVVYTDDRLVVRKAGVKVCAWRKGISVKVRPARPEALPEEAE